MKLEAGKFYKTRDGRKAFVVSVKCPFNNKGNMSDCIGWVDDGDDEPLAYSWRLDGRYSHSLENSRDLVAQWVEPKRIKGWLNISTRELGGYGVGNFHLTRANADEVAGEFRIACIEIDCLEGEGLEVAR